MDNRIDPQLLSHVQPSPNARQISFGEDELVSSDSRASSIDGAIGPGLRRSLSQRQIPILFLPKSKEWTSWVWKHGTIYQGPDKNGVMKDRWRCNLCE